MGLSSYSKPGDGGKGEGKQRERKAGMKEKVPFYIVEEEKNVFFLYLLKFLTGSPVTKDRLRKEKQHGG